MKSFKRHRDYGLFDQDIRLSKISKLGDPLEKLKEGVDFEIFRDFLLEKLVKKSNGLGGRPPYDYVLMFKILILQRYYNLSDDQVEYQINDRMSFMRFLDLTISDDIPDSKTIWNFREQLIELEVIESLFGIFIGELTNLGLIINEGKIVDASFIEVPKQRNSNDENQEIKSGNIPESISSNKNKFAQKDTEARWTKKNNVSYFGYKNHIKTDSKSKLITKYKVTDASVHDSQTMEDLLEDQDKGEYFYADSAYTGENQEAIIESKGLINKVCEKGYRNNPLTTEQKESNKQKSKIRSRVEHIFGFMENSMNGMNLNNIGFKRINGVVGLMNLTYNMFRKIQLQAI